MYIWVVQTINICKNHLLDMLTYAKETIWHKAEAHTLGMERFMGKKYPSCSVSPSRFGRSACAPLKCILLSSLSWFFLMFQKTFPGIAEQSMDLDSAMATVNAEDGWTYRRSLLSVGHLYPTCTNCSTVTVNNHLMKSMLWREMSDSSFRPAFFCNGKLWVIGLHVLTSIWYSCGLESNI